jgi:hypothetical protein
MSWFSWVETVTVERYPVSKNETSESPLMQAAEREATRGALIKRLADEAAMWRKFSTNCRNGAKLWTSYLGWSEDLPVLDMRMDEITTSSWKDFAARMAAQSETRLREILG